MKSFALESSDNCFSDTLLGDHVHTLDTESLCRGQQVTVIAMDLLEAMQHGTRQMERVCRAQIDRRCELSEPVSHVGEQLLIHR